MYICSQLLSSLLTPSTADRNQKMIMYGLPFVFVFFIINFPTGLIVYWITTNLWTVGQGWVLRKRMGPMTAPKDDGASLKGIPGTTTSAVGRGGGFMARMAAVTSAAADKNGAEPEKPSGRGGSSSKPAVAKAKARTPAPAPATAGASSKSGGRAGRAAKSSEPAQPAAKAARSGPPPPPPRKKKKRSGRRR